MIKVYAQDPEAVFVQFETVTGKSTAINFTALAEDTENKTLSEWCKEQQTNAMVG